MDSLKLLERDWRYIKQIKSPTLMEEYLAVTLCSEAILYIDNPSYRACIAAVNNRNPSDEIKMKVCYNDGPSLKFIAEPTEEMQIAAIINNWHVIMMINNPSKNVQMEAINQSSDAYRYIKTPCLEAMLSVS